MCSAAAVEAAQQWRRVPAPQARRGDPRCMAEELRAHKDALGSLVSLENGKIKAEGDGEVQEMIDIADFAVGQSRMLYGLTMHSERAAAPHVRAVASARRRRRDLRVQFPGRRVVLERVPRRHLRQRDRVEALAEDRAVRARRAATSAIACSSGTRCPPSFRSSSTPAPSSRAASSMTGASRWCRSPARRTSGRQVGVRVAERLGKSLLELGGNNAIIVDEARQS